MKWKRQEKNRIHLEFLGGLVVKDSVLSLLWLRFSPWPGSLHMLVAWPKKKKKKKKIQFIQSKRREEKSRRKRSSTILQIYLIIHVKELEKEFLLWLTG